MLTLCTSSMIVLAFAKVEGITNAADLPIKTTYHLLHQINLFHKMSAAITTRKRSVCIEMEEYTWFLIVSTLMLGHLLSSTDLKSTCLLSKGGFSVLMTTFGDLDLTALGLSNFYHILNASVEFIILTVMNTSPSPSIGRSITILCCIHLRLITGVY